MAPSSEMEEATHLLVNENKEGRSNEEKKSSDGDDFHFLPGGMSIPKTAIFIIAEIAGSGILALPKAVADTKWTGIFLMVILGMLAMYCGILLGKCWNIVRQKHTIPPQSRDPYPLIGLYAYGKKGKYLVEICILLTLIGSSVVYLIIASKQISNILNVSLGEFNTPRSEFRMWVLICGVVLIPCTWFATAKEMWLIAYVATLCTLVSCVLINVRAIIYIHEYGVTDISQLKEPTADGFFTAFGTIAFAYGGGSLLPTLQVDMKKPSRFAYAAFLGFLGLIVLYIPCSILPYLSSGSDLSDNVLETLAKMKGSGHESIKIAEYLMTFHLLFTAIIISSPTTQLIEEKIGIPHEFGKKRILIRSLIGLLVIGISELFPNFGPILSLIGASTVTLLSFILPTMFYIKLQDDPLPLHLKVLFGEIILVSLVLGCCGTYSAIVGLENPFKS